MKPYRRRIEAKAAHNQHGGDLRCHNGEARELRVMDPGIRPLVAGTKFVGRAHTVSCFEDFLTVIKGLGEAAAGDVLVVDTRGSRRAVAGGLFPLEARRKQLAAIVIDGPCRDTADIRALQQLSGWDHGQALRNAGRRILRRRHGPSRRPTVRG